MKGKEEKRSIQDSISKIQWKDNKIEKRTQKKSIRVKDKVKEIEIKRRCEEEKESEIKWRWQRQEITKATY